MKTNNNNNNNTSEPSNGWAATGAVMQWVHGQLTGAELSVYLDIVLATAGFRQYTSDFMPIKSITERTGLSKNSVVTALAKLIQSQHIIKVDTNHPTDVGKLPYKYQLNMKLPNFPHLGNLRKSKDEPHTKPSPSAKPEPVLVELPDVSDYFIYGKHVYSVSNPDTAATRDTLISRNLFVHPTASELYKHLTKLNPTIKYINPEE